MEKYKTTNDGLSGADGIESGVPDHHPLCRVDCDPFPSWTAICGRTLSHPGADRVASADVRVVAREVLLEEGPAPDRSPQSPPPLWHRSRTVCPVWPSRCAANALTLSGASTHGSHLWSGSADPLFHFRLIGVKMVRIGGRVGSRCRANARSIWLLGSNPVTPFVGTGWGSHTTGPFCV